MIFSVGGFTGCSTVSTDLFQAPYLGFSSVEWHKEETERLRMCPGCVASLYQPCLLAEESAVAVGGSGWISKGDIQTLLQSYIQWNRIFVLDAGSNVFSTYVMLSAASTCMYKTIIPLEEIFFTFFTTLIEYKCQVRWFSSICLFLRKKSIHTKILLFDYFVWKQPVLTPLSSHTNAWPGALCIGFQQRQDPQS